MFKMQEEMESLKRDALVEMRARGDHKKPIDDEQWQAEIDGYKDLPEFKELLKVDREKKLAELEEKKPKNLAEQQAPYVARLRIIKTIIPQLLRDRETNELLFPTRKEVNAVGELIGSNVELMGLLSKAFARLQESNKPAEDELKN